MIALPDVNVLLALAWEQHPHHNAAHQWFRGAAADGWATCLLTQSSFLRLSMNPLVVHANLDCRAACELLKELIAHTQHRFVADSPPLMGQLFESLAPRVQGYRQMTDATLIWLARSHGLKLATFDRALATLSPWSETVEILPT